MLLSSKGIEFSLDDVVVFRLADTYAADDDHLYSWTGIL